MSVLFALFLTAACAARQPEPPRYEYRQRHMGVEARIVLYAPSADAAVAAARAAFARIALLDSLLSDYRVDSELSQLSYRAGGPPVPISAELFFVLARAQEMARLTGGAFDATAGPVVQLWREARRTGSLPSDSARREALERTGWRHLQLDTASRTARLLRPGMRLDLGGIAKGYAADEALKVLREAGVGSALVEMGGDIVVGAPPPGSRGWRVTLADPDPAMTGADLGDAAISTSGDTEQFVVMGGERYSHVVDPSTGLGLRNRLSATVIAGDGVTADALSTALTVLGPERGRELIERHFPTVRASVRRAEPVR